MSKAERDFEMLAAFGEGVEVVNIITGQRTRTPKARRPRRRRKGRGPSIATLKRWADEGVAEATDGCRVEPDGRCEHGAESWLLVLGLI